jgi:hypothetical protein
LPKAAKGPQTSKFRKLLQFHANRMIRTLPETAGIFPVPQTG